MVTDPDSARPPSRSRRGRVRSGASDTWLTEIRAIPDPVIIVIGEDRTAAEALIEQLQAQGIQALRGTADSAHNTPFGKATHLLNASDLKVQRA